MTKPLLAILLLLPLPTSDLAAHSGGLNSNGCHAGSQPYHCHRATSEMVGNRLRCDLGSRSADCNDASADSKSSPPDLPRGLQEENSRAQQTLESDGSCYVYLDCRDGRTEDESLFGYVRVTPEKAIANLNKFYEWHDREASVDLDYYLSLIHI